MRKTMVLNAFLGVLLVVTMVACGGNITVKPRVDTYTVHEEPPYDLKSAVYEDKDTLIAIKPMPEQSLVNRVDYDRRFKSFALTITNKTKRDMSIEWANIYFINKDSQLNGGFMREGENHERHTRQNMPLLVLANSTHTFKIYPDILIWFYDYRWHHRFMLEGTFGVYISKINGQEKRIKITVDIGESKERKI